MRPVDGTTGYQFGVALDGHPPPPDCIKSKSLFPWKHALGSDCIIMGLTTKNYHLAAGYNHAWCFSSKHWRKLDPRGNPCPKGRSRHSAVCLNYSGDHPQIFVTGGLDSDNRSSPGGCLDPRCRDWHMGGGERAIYHLCFMYY